MDGLLGNGEEVRVLACINTKISKPNIMQLNNIESGSLTLNFPNTRNYQQDMPRSTVVSEIYNDLKRSPPENLPFSLED